MNVLWTQESACNPSMLERGKPMTVFIFWCGTQTMYFHEPSEEGVPERILRPWQGSRSDNCADFVTWDKIFNLFVS